MTVKECPRCALGDFARTKRADGITHMATTPNPTLEKLEEWTFDSVCEATDGCETEPDGRCEHGHSSWLMRLGMI